ncbi:MAG: dephospho-CoA kinase [Propionibacteriaceae bacterium]|jgi:dephospho-CoA kinase|nr:dephospho-CoA kinase [Propionibacteriaceae bacterium]
MWRVGLTGPIAAGKSTVAARLRELGVTVIDDDVLAHDVLAPGSAGARAVGVTFGAGVMAGPDTVDRAKLAAVVFADPAALDRLEAIVHPRVKAAAQDLEDAARARGERLVVHDIPLLVETGQAGEFDEVLVVDAPEDLRVQRLVETRGLSEPEARARAAAQASVAERAAVADVTFDGAGPVAALRDQVTAWWERAARILATR